MMGVPCRSLVPFSYTRIISYKPPNNSLSPNLYQTPKPHRQLTIKAVIPLTNSITTLTWTKLNLPFPIKSPQPIFSVFPSYLLKLWHVFSPQLGTTDSALVLPLFTAAIFCTSCLLQSLFKSKVLAFVCFVCFF